MSRLRLPIAAGRLVLRSFGRGDEADVFAYRSLPDVVRYIPGDPKTEQDVADMVAERATAGRIDEKEPVAMLAVDLGGRVVGDVMVRLDGLDGADGKQAEIGWVFHPDVQGQGYATEAARALTGAAFDQLAVHRVWAQLEPANSASSRICERLGMRREALFERASWFKGAWDDLAIYAILEEEWRSASGPTRS